ncbi:MAG: hypothetical protein ACR2N0_02825 [Rubrobacteraceae bacterium]
MIRSFYGAGCIRLRNWGVGKGAKAKLRPDIATFDFGGGLPGGEA